MVNGYLDCKTCNSIALLGCSTSKGKEWIETKVTVPNKLKTDMQEALRKKVAKHASSNNHKDATETVSKQEKKVIESSILSSKTKSKFPTEKRMRTAYYVGYHNRSYTDYEHLVHSYKRKMVLIWDVYYMDVYYMYRNGELHFR